LKNPLQHLPQQKQDELTRLTEVISEYKEVEMLILFGSYARGNWVEDKYVEKGILYEYRSDFDLLVVLKHEDMSRKFRIEKKVGEELVQTGKVSTTVSMIFHGIKQLNQSLQMGNYFFRDIKEEGIVLYDSGKHKLTPPKKLTPKQYQQKAQDYYNQWFEAANGFYKTFNFNLIENDCQLAAFQLHQSVERYYTAILLVFTDYRPKTHNLETLEVKILMCSKRFAVFPKTTEEEKRLFELLNKAYIDARYKMDEYNITKEDLEYLSARVQELKKLTEEICKEQIKQIGEM